MPIKGFLFVLLIAVVTGLLVGMEFEADQEEEYFEEEEEK